MLAYYKQAFNPPRNYPSAERFADSFVLPTLLIGTAALGRGGLLMTQAVIRPDYVSGPTIAEEVGGLTTMIQAAEAGILISNPSALEALIDADCWVFDDSVSWRFHGAPDGKFVETVSDGGRRDMVYLSSAGKGDAARVAEKFGFSWFLGAYTTGAKRDFIAQKQYSGQCVVYFGTCVSEKEAAGQADLAVNVCEGEYLAQPNVPIFFLNPDLAKCQLLLALSFARMIGLRSTQATVAVPNIAAMVAAIFLNTPVVTSVLLTTLGTAVTYREWTRILRSLE